MAATGEEHEKGCGELTFGPRVRHLARDLALDLDLDLVVSIEWREQEQEQEQENPKRSGRTRRNGMTESRTRDEGPRRGRFWTTGQIAFLRRFVLYMKG